MISAEWDRLMDAPWGKFNPQAIEVKIERMARYRHSIERFWTSRNLPVPTVPTDDRTNSAVSIESWVPRLAPAFAEMKGDIRAEGRL